jgi:hypothetical protein
MRPSEQPKIAAEALAQTLALFLEPVRAADALDKEAVRFAMEALKCATQWTRDYTERARRDAAANAAACQALACAPVPGRGSPLRQALTAYAGAVQSMIDGRVPQALAACDVVANRLA